MRIQLVQTQDKDVNQLQRNVAKVVEPIASNPLVNGIILTEVSLVTSDPNFVNHKLGRKLQGWFVVRMRYPGAAVISDINDTLSSVDQAKLLVLFTDTNVTVDLYVF